MIRTDLLCEDFAKDMQIESQHGSASISKIVLDEAMAKEYGRMAGIYYTIHSDAILKIEKARFLDLYRAFAKILKEFLVMYKINKDDPIFIVGLGNADVTPDSLGPKVIDLMLVTSHLAKINRLEPNMQNVLALAPGVMSQTGLESVDVCKAVCEMSKPKLVIVIDALASRSMKRLNQTIQITNTELKPGSGIGNHRKAFSEDTLGVPVICVGVPTVVDVRSAANELFSGASKGDFNPLAFEDDKIQFMVTPKEIDQNIIDLANVLADGLNLALHNREY